MGVGKGCAGEAYMGISRRIYWYFIDYDYCIKFLLLIVLRKVFKPYNKFFHISW